MLNWTRHESDTGENGSARKGVLMNTYLRLIDQQTLGIPGMRCRDITPIFADPLAFNALITDLCRNLKVNDVDVVVGLEALGFILATAVANRLGKGLVPIRKAGKLPVRTDRLELPVVRAQPRTLELRSGALQAGTRVLLVDDWIKSGTQIAGAIQLIEGQNASIEGVMSLNVEVNQVAQPLLERYRFHTIMRNGQILEPEILEPEILEPEILEPVNLEPETHEPSRHDSLKQTQEVMA
jgi:adenine phosphoribosyltransferase